MATGSLLGKADATLVAGSYREAMADVPADMSKVYEKREKTLKEFTTEVNKIWEKQFEDYKAFETRIIDKSDLALTNVIQGKSNTHNLESVQREVFRIKEKMKTFDKKGKDKGNVEWKKLEEELNKLVITTGANAEAFNSLNEAITNNELHITGAPPKILELYEAMVDDYNNDGSKTKAEYVDGDFVYTHPEDPTVKMTFTELQKKLEIKDSRVPAAMQTVINGVKKHAATSKRPFTKRYANDINNQLVKLMKTPNDIVNVMHERFEGLDYSFYEALTTGSDPALQAQIHDALLSVGTDIDNDGNIDTKKTYLDAENAVALQKEIINGPHSKQIIADFLTDNIVADNYQIGLEERKVDPKSKKNPNDPNAPLFTPNTWVPLGLKGKSITSAQATGIVRDIESGRTFEFEGEQYDHVNGGWYQNYEDGNNEESDNYYGDPEVLRLNVFGTGGNDPRFKNLVTKKVAKMDAATGKEIEEETRQGDTFDSRTNIDTNFIKGSEQKVRDNLNASMPKQNDNRNPEGYIWKEPGILLGGNYVYLEDGSGNRVVYPKKYPSYHEKAGQPHPKAGQNVSVGTSAGNINQQKTDYQLLMEILKTFGSDTQSLYESFKPLP
jgi:hypothetical protein